MTLRKLLPPSPLFAVLFVAGLILQSSALWLRGTGDVRIFKTWALSAASHGLFQAYSPSQNPPPALPPAVVPDYPPLAIFILNGAANAAMAIDPDLTETSRLLTFFVKVPILAARLASFMTVLWVAAVFMGDARKGWMAALLMWLNPALFLNGPALGYLDPLCWAPGLASLALALNNRPILAGLLVAAACATKPQGVFYILPVAAIFWHNGRQLRLAALSAAVTGAVIAAPFLVFGRPADFFDALLVNASEDLLSGNALNLWWLVTVAWRLLTLGAEAFSTRPLYLGVSGIEDIVGMSPRPWAVAVILCLWAVAFLRLRVQARPAQVAAFGALAVHIYFTFAISAHENHLVYAVPLAGIAAMLDRRYWSVYIGLSLFVTLNMTLFYGLGRDFASPPTVILIPISTLATIGGLVLLAHHGQTFRRVTSLAT